MPRGDRTGPDGMGPMTGRGLGYCAGYNSPGYTRGYGQGFGRGRGFGRGYRQEYGRRYGFERRSYYPIQDYPEVSEKTYLENEIKILGDQLKSLEKRLSEMKKEEK